MRTIILLSFLFFLGCEKKEVTPVADNGLVEYYIDAHASGEVWYFHSGNSIISNIDRDFYESFNANISDTVWIWYTPNSVYDYSMGIKFQGKTVINIDTNTVETGLYYVVGKSVEVTYE